MCLSIWLKITLLSLVLTLLGPIRAPAATPAVQPASAPDDSVTISGPMTFDEIVAVLAEDAGISIEEAAEIMR